jgi:pyruvate dehydrogenase (quinone)
LVIAGSSFPYIEFYSKPGKARAVQIDLDPERIGLRYPFESGLVGDTTRVIRALPPQLDYCQARSFLDAARAGDEGVE